MAACRRTQKLIVSDTHVLKQDLHQESLPQVK